jgi:DNA-binding NarL/FixJ family response regulator
MHNNEEFVLKALRSGAAGYLLKDASTPELRLAVEAISRGEIYLSPGVSRQVVSNYISRVNGHPDPLSMVTPRQRQVLHLIAQGYTTKEIAKELRISLSSAETHRTRLMERLNIHDVAGLVRFALQNGLIPSGPPSDQVS